MKYLQILNLTLLALGVTFAVVLAVESLIYALYLNADPALRRQLPMLLQLTGMSCALALASTLTYFAHRRGWRLRWPAQVLPLLAVAGAVAMLAELRR